MEIQIQYYASFREQASKSVEVIEIEEATVGELYQIIKSKYNFDLSGSDVKYAINDSFVEADAKLNDKDQLVFIPPVGGG